MTTGVRVIVIILAGATIAAAVAVAQVFRGELSQHGRRTFRQNFGINFFWILLGAFLGAMVEILLDL